MFSPAEKCVQEAVGADVADTCVSGVPGSGGVHESEGKTLYMHVIIKLLINYCCHGNQVVYAVCVGLLDVALFQ